MLSLHPLPSATRNYHLLAMNFDHYISITPGIRNGKPCLAGTRITVYDVLDWRAA